MLKILKPTLKKLLLAAVLFIVFQALSIFLRDSNVDAGGFPFAYLEGGPSMLILLPSFHFIFLGFLIDVIWFYLSAAVASSYRYGLAVVIILNLLIWD